MTEPRLVLALDDGRASGTLEARDGETSLWSLPVAVARSREVERARARAQALLRHPVEGLPDVVHFVVEGDELLVASRRIAGVRPLISAGGDAATRLVQAAEILDRAAELPEHARAHGAIEASSVRLTPSGRVVIEGWVEGPGGEPADDRRALLRIARSLGLVEGDDNVELDATCVALVKRALARGPARTPVKPASGGLFDAALGVALAGGEGTTPAATATVQALAKTPPASMPPMSAPPPVAAPPTRPAPAKRRRSSRVLVIVGAVALSGAAAVLGLRRGPSETASLVPPSSPPAHAQPDVPPTAPARVDPPQPIDAPRVPPVRTHVRATPPAPIAYLAIRSDSDAAIYVDGKYRADAPAELSLSPGRHVVRLEAAEGALHLLPSEQSVDLVPGEHRAITIDLR